MITIGQITKPQGVRGEVKVKPLTDDPSRFCVLKSVFVGGQPYKVLGARVSGTDVFVKLAGIDDRNKAEELRGKLITIDRAAAVPLGEGEFFIADLIGSTLLARSDGKEDTIGKVVSVQSFGAADVFTIDIGGAKQMTFAFVKALNAEYDENSNTLCVDGERLKEVAVYDED